MYDFSLISFKFFLTFVFIYLFIIICVRSWEAFYIAQYVDDVEIVGRNHRKMPSLTERTITPAKKNSFTHQNASRKPSSSQSNTTQFLNLKNDIQSLITSLLKQIVKYPKLPQIIALFLLTFPSK